MSDKTETTSEVARVLNLHASFKASAEIQDPDARWYWECDGCDIRLALSGTYGRPEVVAALAAHQAAMLAEAGLLRAQHEHAWISDRALCSSVGVQWCATCGATREIENEEGA